MTQFTRDYIKHSSDESKPLYVKYPFVNKKVWENFERSRTTPDLWAKSQQKRKMELGVSIHMDCVIEGMIKLNRK